MSDPKNFLERWSRRKLDSVEAPEARPSDKPNVDSAEKTAASPAAPAQTAPVTEVDLGKLPSIESIGTGTDIKVFLQRGVPASLTRAALRRAWSADPAIRDFIGLSENSWDFTAPDSLPGFGPLKPEDIRRVAEQLFGEPSETAVAGNSLADRNSLVQSAPLPMESGDAPEHEMRTAAHEQSEDARLSQVQGGKNLDKKTDVMNSAGPSKADIAMQHQEQDNENDSPAASRSHGGALPK